MNSARRLGMLRPLRHRDFAKLWTGLFVSLIGDGVYLVAIAWQVYDLSNSPAALADSISDSMAAARPEIALPAMDSMLAWARDRQDIAVSALQAPIGLIMAAGGRTTTTRFQRSRGTQSTIGIDEVPGGGHFLMLEIPEAFNAQLRVLLGRIRTIGST